MKAYKQSFLADAHLAKTFGNFIQLNYFQECRLVCNSTIGTKVDMPATSYTLNFVTELQELSKR